MERSGATEEMELDQTRAKNGSQQSLCHSSHMDTRRNTYSRKTEDHMKENSGKRKRTTRTDIIEPSPNESTEQKQLASSYQSLMRQRSRRRKVKVKPCDRKSQLPTNLEVLQSNNKQYSGNSDFIDT